MTTYSITQSMKLLPLKYTLKNSLNSKLCVINVQELSWVLLHIYFSVISLSCQWAILDRRFWRQQTPLKFDLKELIGLKYNNQWLKVDLYQCMNISLDITQKRLLRPIFLCTLVNNTDMPINSYKNLRAAAKSRQSLSDSVQPHRRQPTRLPSLGFSRQEHWSGLPFPSPVHESEE